LLLELEQHVAQFFYVQTKSMEEIKIFNSPQFGEIRTTGTSENPLFCLSDVCSVLGLRQGDVKQRLDKGVVSTQPLETAGGIQQANFVNEDGLYDVILDSRKPQAKAFRKWVTSEVLPAIRKTGGYIATKTDDTPEEIMARALTIAQATLEKREERLKQLEADNQQKDAKIAKLQPKADFADAAFITDDKVDIGMAAKILKLGFRRNTLFQKLRQVGVFFSNRNEPKQRFVNAGYFEMKEKFIERNSHPGFVVTKILVTQKGLAYINHLFGGNPSDGKIAAIE
jgi:prophage antirepressor-like protein